jgi:Ca2+-binding RTX toxin-like protein
MAAIAASPSASVHHGILQIDGTDGTDHIRIGLDVHPRILLVHLGDGQATRSFDRSTFNSISVSLHRAADTFAVSVDRGAFSDEALTVHAGPGRDTLIGGAGDDLLVGGGGSDTIRGGDGTDLVRGNDGGDTIDGGRGTDTEFLGRGDDVARWVPGEGCDIIDGGTGHDTLHFTGSSSNESFALEPDGARTVLTRDVGLIRMNLAGVERLELATRAGVDKVLVSHLPSTDLEQAAVDLSIAGDGDAQPDSVVVEGTDGADGVGLTADGGAVTVRGLQMSTRITGSEPTDQLVVSTGDGDDFVDIGDAVQTLIGLVIDLGVDQS